MRWTEQAKTAARHALAQGDADRVNAAIIYAEQLAENVNSAIVDSDLWRRAWSALSHARLLARHQHEIPDAR
jgi:hypothetical protein